MKKTISFIAIKTMMVLCIFAFSQNSFAKLGPQSSVGLLGISGPGENEKYLVSRSTVPPPVRTFQNKSKTQSCKGASSDTDQNVTSKEKTCEETGQEMSRKKYTDVKSEAETSHNKSRPQGGVGSTLDANTSD